MGYKHSRDDLLRAARDVALEDGITALTFRAVGTRAGVSDRTVVYYFPTKTDLIQDVTGTIGLELQELLASAFGSQPLPPADLLSRAWPTLTTPHADRIFALMFEIIGLAGAARAPYVDIAAGLIDAWVDWLVPRTTGSTAAGRRRHALATIAQLDGLLLVRLIAGPAAADQAAKGLGMRVSAR
jgi:AcrR family transcriptional regulator